MDGKGNYFVPMAMHVQHELSCDRVVISSNYNVNFSLSLPHCFL